MFDLIFGLLLVSAAIAAAAAAAETANDTAPRVETSDRIVIGRYKTTFKGRKYEVYEGIPYCLPPIGELRFAYPQIILNKHWGKLEATNGSHRCVQYLDVPPNENGETPAGPGRVVGSEDCLHLSINAPARQDKSQLLPVIAFIHGGSFQYGSGLPFASDNPYLMDRDVVFVAMNYRLNVLGFLSTEDKNLPGNLGLKDQQAALIWIHNEIKAFGGDPDRVTLVGFSAGASSVQYHYLSPVSRGLFHAGIAISGSILNPWGFALNAREKARKLAALVNCPGTNDEDTRRMVECIKKKPAYELATATKEFQRWQFMPEAPFAPVVEPSNSDWSFITRAPEELMRAKRINDVPIVFTTVSEEGCDPGAAYASHDKLLKQLNDHWLSLAPHVLQYNYTLPIWQHRFVARFARLRYFGKKPIDAGTDKALIRLLTDKHYLYDIERAARMHAEASESPVYLYYYSFQSGQSRSRELSHSDKNYGVCHCDDVLLVTREPEIDIDAAKSKKALAMSNLLMDIWESVAYDRKPSVKGVEWLSINATDRKTAFLHIRGPKDYRMSSSCNMGNKRFWDLFFDQQILYDFEEK
ncbi:venom carboxylesterase-6-like [Trichogramma pretiosum]|uniref:venom carboxylesterase-6-like n=1 Tax=Trichogramma pretiosum TaxID=7493 RepID=UPI000C71C443|nr:venom carboxylesterase-6-like [Trichogramma pretiosum]